MSLEQVNESQPQVKLRSRPIIASVILFGGAIALLFFIALSISVGASSIPLSTVWDSVFHFDPEVAQHQVIKELRIPRVLAGGLVGAAFAVSGSIMQGMTRNPLADPSLLGINAGAVFMLAICFAFFPGMSYMNLMLYSFIGAALGVGIVYGISSLTKGGLTPVRLTLAGAAVSALFVAFSNGIQIHFKLSQEIAFFYYGGIAGINWMQIKVIAPWIIGGLVGAMVISRSISLLSLGDDVAAGLGQRTGLIKVLGLLFTLVLAGAAVSVAGAVGFVGLIIPHIVRYLVGVDYRWIIPCSAMLGAILVVLADISARLINPPSEAPIGALIALIGVPFFLFLAVRMRREL